MLLKRQFEDGKCTSVLVKHTGLSPEQNFSRRLVTQAVAAGWMKIEGDRLTIIGDPEDLHYIVRRTPGYYCAGTGARIPISEMAWVEMLATGRGELTRREALAYLAEHDLPENGYEVTMAYECVLDQAQHEKFRAVRAVSGNVVAAHTVAGA